MQTSRVKSGAEELVERIAHVLRLGPHGTRSDMEDGSLVAVVVRRQGDSGLIDVIPRSTASVLHRSEVWSSGPVSSDSEI